MPLVAKSAPGVSNSASRPRARAAGEQAQRGADRQDAHRDVDVEHPPPSRSLGQDAAEEHAGRGGETADRTPDAERRVAIGALVERRRQDRQRGRRHHRRADPLEQASGDEHPLAARQARRERARAEHDQAGEEDPPSPEQVGESAAEQQQPPVGQQIAARDPLQVLLREVKRALDRRERDVRDR